MEQKIIYTGFNDPVSSGVNIHSAETRDLIVYQSYNGRRNDIRKGMREQEDRGFRTETEAESGMILFASLYLKRSYILKTHTEISLLKSYSR